MHVECSGPENKPKEAKVPALQKNTSGQFGHPVLSRPYLMVLEAPTGAKRPVCMLASSVSELEGAMRPSSMLAPQAEGRPKFLAECDTSEA